MQSVTCPFCQSVCSFLTGHTSFLSTLLCMNAERLQPPHLCSPPVATAAFQSRTSHPLSVITSLHAWKHLLFPTYYCKSISKMPSPSLFNNAQHFLYQPPVLFLLWGLTPLQVVDDSHLTPHPPLFNYIYASALLASVSHRASECYSPYTALSSLLPPLLSPSTAALLGQPGYTREKQQQFLKPSTKNSPHGGCSLAGMRN